MHLTLKYITLITKLFFKKNIYIIINKLIIKIKYILMHVLKFIILYYLLNFKHMNLNFDICINTF